jgi:hypothetical protein
MSGDPCTLISDYHRTLWFRSFLAIVPFVLSLTTAILNSLFIYLVYLHVFKKRRSSRKRYLFLFNQSFCAIIAQFLVYVVLITWKAHKFKYSTASIFLFVGGLTLFSSTFTYIIVTLLLYTAITASLLENDYKI